MSDLRLLLPELVEFGVSVAMRSTLRKASGTQALLLIIAEPSDGSCDYGRLSLP